MWRPSRFLRWRPLRRIAASKWRRDVRPDRHRATVSVPRASPWPTRFVFEDPRQLPVLVREAVLAAELGADAGLDRDLEDLLLHLEVAEGAPELVARSRQVVEGVGAGQLDGLEVEFGRGAADHQRQVVGRAIARSGPRAAPRTRYGKTTENAPRLRERRSSWCR